MRDQSLVIEFIKHKAYQSNNLEFSSKLERKKERKVKQVCGLTFQSRTEERREVETGELLRIATPNALELDKSCPSLGALFQAARQTAKVIQLQQQSLNLNIHRV